MPVNRVRADFVGGPADGQYRIFVAPAPETINWMTADGPFVYELTQSGGKYTYQPQEEAPDA